MGFLTPLALLALPLAALPFLLEWQGRRTGAPVRFSSLYLLERARRSPARRVPTRSRWVVLLRALVLALLVLAAARPVGPGRCCPALHHPTRAVVVVDVSASVGQRREGRPAWAAVRAAADSVLAAGSPADRLALAAVADGLAGWWEGSPPELRHQLARLAPGARASDWPAALAAVADRLEEEGTETYWLTDGARGRQPPAGAADSTPPAALPAGRHVVRIIAGSADPNRALVAARRPAPEQVALAGRAWGEGAPVAAEVARWEGDRPVEPQALPLDGEPGPATWAAGDSATFGFVEADRLPADDRLYVARGAGGPYRVVRWAPPDEPPEPGTLFWEAAVAAAARGATVERAATLEELAARAPDLALLPLRTYRPDQAALLAEAAAAGTRLLFAPSCPDPACVPPAGWWPAFDPAAPDLVWSLGAPDRQTALASRPAGAEPAPDAGVPDPLVARVPIRGALRPAGGPRPDWTWPLATGPPALWVGGPLAVWLVPLGPPVTRLGTTPVFPLVAEAALSAWDPRWAAGGSAVQAGAPIPVPAGGAVVTGPLRAGASAGTWSVAPGGAPPRPAVPGIYRVEPVAPGVRGEPAAATFVAVNVDPAEGDLTPIAPAAWRAAGLQPVEPGGWRAALFPRRRGPELWPWLLALALAALAAEAALRRGRSGPPQPRA